tara:strand:+ start:1070 stop:2374 length:1305 start_codon:yes stop_codon:yes gene_type:complete
MLNEANKDILLKSFAGVEFEFYSNTSVEETAKSVGQVLGRKIQLETKAHSDFVPTDKVFKMEPDMSGGAGLIELVTGPLPYIDVRLVIIKMLHWISENGYTNDRCGLHLNISFDKDKVGKYFITHMNTLKFILEFDENQVYKFFPKREDLVYAKSIKYILPKNGMYYFDENTVNSQQFKYPDSKYYGVNFLKQNDGYLEFRYLGGKDYEKQVSTTLHLLDMFILQVFNVCQNPNLNELNRLELRRIMRKMQPTIDLYKDHRNFSKFKDITFTLDLSEDGGNSGETIDMYWSQIRDAVIKLITEGSMKSGHINYDTDRSKIQIKNGVFEGAHDLEGYEFVDCEISGEIKSSDLYRCKIKNADFDICNFFQSCELESSKVKSSYIHSSCTLNDCYVFGRDGVFKGTMKNGIFREGKYSEKLAKFDGTEIVQSTKID